MNATAKSPNALAIDTRSEDSLVVLSVEGAIDSTNCAALRDAIIKATLDEPSAVVVNVSALQVPDEASWSIFVSARWQVDTPQHVPILLVCASRAGRELITRTGVTRFMPVYPTEKRAIKPSAGSRDARCGMPRCNCPPTWAAFASPASWSASGSRRGRNPG